ncbi:MAG TPA: pilus assembly protein PilM [Pseudomonas sp.]|uniref:type IV pilus biogenesis protein PilM n=1 Tax=Pseudomonas sp. TaxID=306 RepID=UPI000EDDA080|nr:type IV pilus assembly protein PilM [Pseudomonas sp.]HCN64539.1 pilus assembly protein PilM [Pseudomonas sp.]
MPGYFCKARQRYVGVDIGSHTIKIVELSRSNGPFHLEAYAVEPLPATLMDDQTSAEPKSVAQVLLKALGAASVSAREAVVALPDTHVICKQLEVDAGLSDDELELYVRLEAEQYIPYALDEAALDFDVLGPSPNNPEQLHVLLVTCRQHTLAWYEAVLSQAGLKARVVAVQAHALARAIEGATPLVAEAQLPATVAVIDVAGHTTLLSVVHQGQVLYARELLFGADTREEGAFNPGALEQVKRGLEQYAESVVAPAVQSLWLAGAIGARSGLSAWFEARLGLPVHVANPFSQMTISPLVTPQALRCDAPMLLTACGLALRGFD